jgi:hypothetical protein
MVGRRSLRAIPGNALRQVTKTISGVRRKGSGGTEMACPTIDTSAIESIRRTVSVMGVRNRRPRERAVRNRRAQCGTQSETCAACSHSCWPPCCLAARALVRRSSSTITNTWPPIAGGVGDELCRRLQPGHGEILFCQNVAWRCSFVIAPTASRVLARAGGVHTCRPLTGYVGQAHAAGGARAVVAESLLLKHQLLILKRSRNRAPNFTSWDRLLLGLVSLVVRPRRIAKIAIALKPATLMRFHQALTKLKYHLLFVSRRQPLWLSPHCTGDCARPWHRYRQRRRPPCAREALSTRVRNRWPVLAELHRACEGQPVECRSVPLRIDTPAQPLGHGGDGRVHTPDHRLWR